MKTTIVCEGGGMRGVYTAGVLQAFMDGGFLPSEIIGVSAGALNAASYVAWQAGRGYRMNVNYTNDPRYCSLRSFIKTGSVFGMDFIFDEISEYLDPFDYDGFFSSPCAYYAGATNLRTGKAEFFGKEDIVTGLGALRASCALPLFSPIVEIAGESYLDGGVADPIPVDQALKNGCQRLIVILTRQPGYLKKPPAVRSAYHAMYRKYPNFVKAMDLRYLVYNHSLQRLARLVQRGQALVIAPKQPPQVDRFGKNKAQLIKSYFIGMDDGSDALKRLG